MAGKSKLPSRQELMDIVRSCHAAVSNSQTFSQPLETLRIVSVESEPHGFVKAELLLEKKHCNAYQGLHGAMTTLILDLVGSYACVIEAQKPNMPEFWRKATSAEMNTSYIRPALLGETIVIEARCLKVGRGLSFANVNIFRKSDGLLVASGRHTMFKNSRL